MTHLRVKTKRRRWRIGIRGGEKALVCFFARADAVRSYAVDRVALEPMCDCQVGYSAFKSSSIASSFSRLMLASGYEAISRKE